MDLNLNAGRLSSFQQLHSFQMNNNRIFTPCIDSYSTKNIHLAMIYDRLHAHLNRMPLATQSALRSQIRHFGGKDWKVVEWLAIVLFQTRTISNEAELWKLWQPRPVFDYSYLNANINALDVILQTFEKPIAHSGWYQRFTTLDKTGFNDFLTYLAMSNAKNKVTLQAFLHSTMAATTVSSKFDRLTLWQHALPNHPFDAKIYRSATVGLSTLWDRFHATMQDTKLYQWLDRLTKKERAEFLQFVSVFGDGRREQLAHLLKVFLAHVVGARRIRRHAFFATWKPGVLHDDNMLNHGLNALLKLLKQYLATKELHANPKEMAVFTVKALDKRDWADFFKPEYEDTLDEFANDKIDHHHHRLLMQLEEAAQSQQVVAARNKFNPATFETVMQHTADFFHVQILRFAAAALTRASVIGTPNELAPFKETLEALTKPSHNLPPLGQAYRLVYQMLIDGTNPAHFQHLLTMVMDKKQRWTTEVTRSLLKHLLNYGARQLRSGNRSYKNELSVLYEFGIKQELILQPGTSTIAELRNTIQIFVSSGKAKLARRTYAASLPNMPPQTSTTDLKFLEAILVFHERQFSTARKLFAEVLGESKDEYFFADARLYRWMCTWELGELHPQGKDKEAGFVYEEKAMWQFLKRMGTKHRLYDSIHRFFKYMNRMYAVAINLGTKKEICALWQTLLLELQKDGQARMHDFLVQTVQEKIVQYCANLAQ